MSKAIFLFSRAKALEEEVNLVGNNLRSLQISEDQVSEKLLITCIILC